MDNDSITLSIESESKRASESIGNLVKDLQSLQKTLTSTVSNIKTTADNLKNLSNSFEGGKAKKDIDDIKQSIDSLNNSTKNVKSPFAKFGSLESQLDKLGLPNLNSSFYKLQSSIKTTTSETNRYKTANGQLVTVVKQTKDGLEGVKVTLKEVNDEAKKGESLWSRLTKGLTGSVAKMVAAWYGVTRTATKIKEITNAATEYEEALNLFTVTMGSKAEDAMKWVDMFSKALYIDDSGLMQYMGSLNSLISGLGVGADKSYLMSKNLTQLVYDLASFKNLDIETSFRKIQSAMSGEIEPLRNVGVALSQNTLQELANKLGIEQRVATMSEAEKAQLRYIQIIKSTTEWQGDMARTLISPSNALRVLKQQFTLLGRAIGRVFIPFVMKAIPYIMALTQILTDFANKLAAFFGYKITDIDYSSLKDVKFGIEDIGDEADSTSKKLNTMLAPFDELNVVQKKNEKSGSGLGLGGDLALDLPEYDALAGLASQMADNVERAKKNFKNMVKPVATIVGLITTFKAIKTLGNVAQWLNNTGGAIKGLAGLFGFKNKDSVSKVFDKALKDSGKTAGLCADVQSRFKLPKWSTIIKGLGQLALVVTAVVAYVGALGLFAQIPGVKDIISDGADILEETFTTIAKILIPLTAVSVGVVALGSLNISQIALGLADMGIIILGTEAVITAVGVINKLAGDWLDSGLEAIKKTFNGIADIAVPLVAVAGAFALTGLAGGEGVAMFSLGLANFAIIIGGTTTLLTAIGGLLSIPGFSDFLETGITSVKSVFEGLYDIAVPLGIFTSYILVLGFATPVTITSGLLGFAEIVGGISVLLTALGGLKQIPGFDWILGEGSTVLSKIGNILGDFAGSIVAGFVGKATSTLPKVGDDLSEFMENATPFFEQSAKIDKDTMQGMNYLISALLKLTGQNILDSLTSWFTGGSSLTEFGKDLKDFAPNFKKYAKEMESVKSNVVTKTSNAVDSVMKFSRKVPNEGGMISWFTGDNQLGKFGKQLPDFGKNFKKYYNEVADIKSDVVEKSSDAALSIIEFSRKVPNEGGMVAWFAGDNTIDKFGKKLPDFGKNLKTFADNVSGMETDVVDKAGKAAGSVAEFANNLPDYGGMKSWFVGDNDIAKFGRKLATFGENFEKYYNTIKSIETDKVINSTNAIGELVKYLVEIKDKDLANVVNDFGKALKNNAPNFKAFFEQSFSNSLADDIGKRFGERLKTAIQNGMNPLKVTVETETTYNNKLPWNIPSPFKPFAEGGFPQTGELFLAREAGAEMVGKIGNQTAVANNDQITTGIKNAVIEAFDSINNNKQPIHNTVYIGNRKVFDGMNDYINSENDRYGTNYVSV